jgi:Cu2+-containing amine oxidase
VCEVRLLGLVLNSRMQGTGFDAHSIQMRAHTHIHTHIRSLSGALQVNCEALPPGPSNPYGNAWVARETPLSSVKAAQRVNDPFTNRVWMFTNPNVSAAIKMKLIRVCYRCR